MCEHGLTGIGEKTYGFSLTCPVLCVEEKLSRSLSNCLRHIRDKVSWRAVLGRHTPPAQGSLDQRQSASGECQ